MAHTPTPWAVVNDTVIVKWGTTHRPMAAVIGEVKPAANAAFIVKAVNAHDELVAALRELHVDQIATWGTGNREVQIIRALLAKLED